MVAIIRGPSVSILDTICSLGVVILELKVTKDGTKWNEFMVYLTSVMNVLDCNYLKGCHLVLGDIFIHKLKTIMKEAEKRGYKVICLPPCSPFLNPIEEFWTKIKIIVRRSPMTDRDSLVTRIVEAGKSVPAKDGQG